MPNTFLKSTYITAELSTSNIILAQNNTSPFGGPYGMFKGCSPETDLKDAYAEHTPIQIAPGLDPRLPPPPKDHYPNTAWKAYSDGWSKIPMPMKGEGGAYMYVDNVWQYVEQPKFYAYKMDTSTCTWRMVPPTAVSKEVQQAMRFNNQEAEGFPQELYDMLRQEWLSSWLGYSKTNQAKEQIIAGNTNGAIGTIGLKAAGDFFSIGLVIGGIWLVIKIARLWSKANKEARKEWAKHQGRVHGSARWMEGEELDAYGMKGSASTGLVVGLWDDGHTSDLIRFNEKGHLLTFAPTGAGKGVGSIIPNLLTYPGSFVCIDPKGENAVVTAPQRTKLGNVVLVLDPFQRTAPYLPGCQVTFNPLAMIDPDGPRASDDATILAEALVPNESKSSDPFWDTEARALLSGLILYVAAHVPPERRNLAHVRDLLNSSPDDWKGLLLHMSKSDNRLVAAAGNRALQKVDKEAAGILSSAQSHTHFLDSEAMRRMVSGPPFDMAKLKTHDKPISLYLVLPAEELRTHSRWLRVMISMILTALSREAKKPEHDVLFMLDEFAALGHMPIVETAMGLMRGYGIKLWPILQDLPQLKHTYQKWESFVANAGCIQFFGVNDKETAEYASKLLGQETVSTTSQGTGHSSQGNTSSTTLSYTGRALMMPDEVMRLPDWQMLLTLRAKPPVLCVRPVYYESAVFAPLAAENPFL